MAQSPGESLAKSIEAEENGKRRHKLIQRVEGLSVEEKSAFVAWARKQRLKTKLPWERLSKALGKIGTQAAAEELGEVARFVNKGEIRGLSSRVNAALDALTSIPPSVSVPILLKGLQDSDREVRSRHRRYLGRFAAEGTALGRDGPLREVSREARRLQERRDELLDRDPSELAEVAAEIHGVTEKEKLLTSLVTDTVTRSNHLQDHLRYLADVDQPAAILHGTIQGIGKRGSQRLAPLHRAVRRLRKQLEREAKRDSVDVEPVTDEEARRKIFRDKPQLERLWTAVQAELPQLEEALAKIAESEQPDIQYEAFVALPAVRRGLTQAWADLAFPFLKSKNLSWVAGVAKALTRLTGVSKYGQSKDNWEAWWKRQAGADE